MDLDTLYAPIQTEMDDISTLIKEKIKKSQFQAINDIGSYLGESLGKQLRPALMVFSMLSFENSPAKIKHAIKIGAAIELIHMASLIHDDILDKADIRHNKPTIVKKWGADIAIPMGVYLYSLSLELIADTGNTDILHDVSRSVSAMCEGEIFQVDQRGNSLLSLEEYLGILERKTGALFSTSCRCGAILADQTVFIQDQMAQFGMNLGVLFQLTDDVLDIVDAEASLKKGGGQDFQLGEMTLPIILMTKDMTSQEKNQMDKLLARSDAAALEELMRLVKFDMIISDIQKLLLTYEERAKDTLSHLSSSAYKDRLETVLRLVIQRAMCQLETTHA
ncbi:MAG: polyprenyl synthetase family protein [Candidatus Margulisbacteria bacterium]|nr:polyprenyl synthetase family protein [Candidatus Margulisiibacteriota bacterium]